MLVINLPPCWGGDGMIGILVIRPMYSTSHVLRRRCVTIAASFAFTGGDTAIIVKVGDSDRYCACRCGAVVGQ